MVGAKPYEGRVRIMNAPSLKAMSLDHIPEDLNENVYRGNIQDCRDIQM
jgi:hypothetical protein